MTKIYFGEQHDGNEEHARVGTVRGHVVIHVGVVGNWLDGWDSAMTPQKARELAEALYLAADEIEAQEGPPTGEEIYTALEGE